VLFAGYATRLIVNLNFQLKIGLIVLGGLSVWGLARMIQAHDGTGPYPAAAKAAAVMSGLLWFGAIFTGRYIAYTLAPPSFL